MDRGLYQGFSNIPHEKRIAFKFFLDAGNAPTLAASPANLYISGVSRVSQGLYRVTFMDTFKTHVGTDVHLNVNGSGVARWAQPGPVANVGTSTAVTVDVLVVDNAGAVQDPAAANSNNFIYGEAVFSDTAAV